MRLLYFSILFFFTSFLVAQSITPILGDLVGPIDVNPDAAGNLLVGH
ncbi:MAG: hypothetical protein AAFU03_03420 [Bacteroidota bacterium]